MPEILLLPEKTRTRLRSTQIITSLPQLISELLQNALDAGAKHVDISIDCDEWTCTVRDDGVGIPRDGLKLLAAGGEGGRYGTSKAYNERSLEDISTFGFRGEALASVADISCLEISSRTAGAKESWSVIVKGGKELYVGPAIRWRRESPGTTVCIRDAFYNLPIRRTSHTAPARTVELVKKEIEVYALMFPGVTFSVETANKSKETHGKNRILTILPTGSTLLTFKSIYGGALIEHVHEINAEDRGMVLKGFISLVGAPSKSHQYLYVNRHPMSSGDIHHAIETRFAWSSFSKHAFDEEGITQSPRPATRRSPRKNERRPVYVINLDVPPSQFDNCIDPNKSLVQFKNLQDVVTFVLNAVQDFLVLHGFANPVDRSPVASLRGSPRKRARRDSKGISLVHEGIGASPMNSPCSYRSVRAEAHAYQESAIFNSCTDQSFLPLNGSYQDEDVFLSSTRRGSLFPSHTGKKSGGLENPPDRYTLTTKSTKIHDTVSETTKDTPAWLSNVLSRNGAYTSSESRAPSINPIANPLAPTPKNSRHNMKTISALLQGRGTDISRRITRSDLASAQVISQVDTKFIACLIRSSPDHGRHQDNLILIDQHAADERVRVERFLDDLCTSYLRGQVQRRTLAPEKLILATECERRLLSRDDIREAFSKWGFSFNLPPVASSGGYGLDEESDTYVQVGVESVPDIIGDKLLLADELKDFVKNYVSKLEGGDIQEYPTQEPIDLDTLSSEGPVWLKALRFCPPELLDLVNSKACRGAIMFNDPLELDQCERLVSQLSKTVYPFQCAHGRPTLVPLTAIDGPKSYARPVDWGRLDA